MDLVLVGRVARAHGNKGQVIVNLETDFAEDRFQVGRVLLVGPTATPRTVRSVRFQHGRPVVGFEGVETMNDAEALAGAELKAPAGGPGALPRDTYYHYDLAGCEVHDTAGARIGRVASVEGTMEMSRLVVEGPVGEVLIPLVADICVNVDVVAKRITVELPEGLVDLNGTRRERGRR
jgi:16S rRNA processing protein RimM